MRSGSVVALALAGILSALGCSSDSGGSDGEGGGGPPQGTPSSCDLSVDFGYCVDFPSSAPQGTAKTHCDDAKTTLAAKGILKENAPCTPANRVGTCVATIGGVVTSYRYYSPKFTTASATQNCQHLAAAGGAAGKFTPQ